MSTKLQGLEIARQFMVSRIVLTSCEIGIMDTLIHEKMDAIEIAKRHRIHGKGANRLLDAMVAIGLLHKENGLYEPTETGAPLAKTHPETVFPMIMHMNDLWYTWSNLTEAVTFGSNPKRITVHEKTPESVSAFIGAMHVAGKKLSRKIAQSIDFSSYSKLLDIGGGSGTYTISFLTVYPEMKACLFDLPFVTPLAEDRINQAGLEDRVEIVQGNYNQDALPEGCDLALLSAIIHQNGPDENLALFERICDALLSNGALLIRDQIMEPDRTAPASGAIFALNMLVNTEKGDTYTFQEIEGQLRTAGFDQIERIRQGEHMDDLILARKGQHE